MCTVSWLHEGDGYHLLCNRDEKRQRRRAITPRIEPLGGVNIVTPRDGEMGGTWIAANEFGVSVCLLNGASLGHALPGGGFDGRASRSRGELLLDLANSRTVREACQRAACGDLSRYAPFTIVALEPGQPAGLVEWNGVEKAMLLNGESFMPLASSSWDADGVRAWRRQEFARLAGRAGGRMGAEALYAFHESHGSHAGAYAPCMHRPDAETVSFSWLTITPETVSFFYAPGAPCQLQNGELTRLSRVH